MAIKGLSHDNDDDVYVTEDRQIIPRDAEEREAEMVCVDVEGDQRGVLGDQVDKDPNPPDEAFGSVEDLEVDTE